MRTSLGVRATARLVLAAVVSLGVCSGAATAARAPLETSPPCVRGQALLDAALYADAVAAFKSELGRGPCALTGYRAAKAAAAKAATDGEAASFDEAVGKIRRLEAQGFESDARTAAKSLVEDFPDRTLPRDLRAIDQPVAGWWRQLGGLAGPPLRFAVELLAILLLLRALWSVVVRSVRSRYVIRDLDGANDATGQTDLLASELNRIGGTDAGDHVRRVAPSEAEFSLPAAITDAYPQTAVAAAAVSLLDRVLPRRLKEISATALPVDPVRGAGVTVAISKRSGRRVSEMTMWEQQFTTVAKDTPIDQRLQRLMLPAAAWIAYELRASAARTPPSLFGTTQWMSYAQFAIGERLQHNGETKLARRAYYRALDVDSGNLAARLNLAGLLLYRRGATPDVEAENDPATRLKLAAWLLTDREVIPAAWLPSEEQPAFPVPQRESDQVRLQLRWLYVVAALCLVTDDQARAPVPPSTGPPTDSNLAEVQRLLQKLSAAETLVDQAAAAARVLHDAVKAEAEATRVPATSARNQRWDARWMAALKGARKRAGRKSEVDFADLAREMRWPAFVLLKSASIPADEAGGKALLEDLSSTWWTANTLYNLACYEARLVDGEPEPGKRLRTARRHLLDAVDRAQEPKLMLAMADSDPTLDPVMRLMTKEDRASLTGAPAAERPHKAEAERGEGIAVEILEAIKTLALGAD